VYQSTRQGASKGAAQAPGGPVTTVRRNRSREVTTGWDKPVEQPSVQDWTPPQRDQFSPDPHEAMHRQMLANMSVHDSGLALTLCPDLNLLEVVERVAPFMLSVPISVRRLSDYMASRIFKKPGTKTDSPAQNFRRANAAAAVALYVYSQNVSIDTYVGVCQSVFLSLDLSAPVLPQLSILPPVDNPRSRVPLGFNMTVHDYLRHCFANINDQEAHYALCVCAFNESHRLAANRAKTEHHDQMDFDHQRLYLRQGRPDGMGGMGQAPMPQGQGHMMQAPSRPMQRAPQPPMRHNQY
ncbi:hypothetical protein KIPB_007302, partial [Kipferlia bialata]